MKQNLKIALALAAAAGLALAQATTAAKPADTVKPAAKPADTGKPATKPKPISLRLASVHGDTFDILKLKQPLVLLVSSTDSASGAAAQAVEQVFAAATQPAMYFDVIQATMKEAKAAADRWELGYVVLSDPAHKTMEWLFEHVPAKTLSPDARVPFVVFMDAGRKVIKAETKVTEANVIDGVTALSKRAEKDKVTDPACGMALTKASAAATYDYNGQTYYFCSTACKDSFAKDPQKYIAK